MSLRAQSVAALAHVQRKNALARNKGIGIPAIRFLVVVFILFLVPIRSTLGYCHTARPNTEDEAGHNS